MSVFDTAGQPLSGARVTYGRSVQAVGARAVPAPGEVVANGQLTSVGSGIFSASGLPAGTYVLCADVPGAAYVDPCVWAQGIRVPVSAGATATASVTMQKGVFLKVRIDSYSKKV